MGRRLLGAIVVAGAFAGVAGAGGFALQGTYSTTISGLPVALLNSAWSVQFQTNGHYVIKRAGAVVVTGVSTSIGPSKVKLTDKSGPAACTGPTVSGTYTWSFAKRGGHTYLAFKTASDACLGRNTVLTTHALLKLK